MKTDRHYWMVESSADGNGPWEARFYVTEEAAGKSRDRMVGIGLHVTLPNCVSQQVFRDYQDR